MANPKKVFTLSILLSSYFLYNSIEDIDESIFHNCDILFIKIYLTKEQIYVASQPSPMILWGAYPELLSLCKAKQKAKQEAGEKDDQENLKKFSMEIKTSN